MVSGGSSTGSGSMKYKPSLLELLLGLSFSLNRASGQYAVRLAQVFSSYFLLRLPLIVCFSHLRLNPQENNDDDRLLLSLFSLSSSLIASFFFHFSKLSGRSRTSSAMPETATVHTTGVFSSNNTSFIASCCISLFKPTSPTKDLYAIQHESCPNAGSVAQPQASSHPK